MCSFVHQSVLLTSEEQKATVHTTVSWHDVWSGVIAVVQQRVMGTISLSCPTAGNPGWAAVGHHIPLKGTAHR